MQPRSVAPKLALDSLNSHFMFRTHTTLDAIKQSTSSSLTSILLFGFLYICCAPKGHAFQVYKWVDENGRVHYGDRANAPANGKKLDIKVQEPAKAREASSSQAPRVISAPDNLPAPIRPPDLMPPPSITPPTKKASKPVDPAKVPVACKGIVDQIAKVEAGKSWEGLAKIYNATCPGIAYECSNYKRTPEKNLCQWVERSDSTILRTSVYE